MEAFNGSYKTEKKNNASGMVLKRCTIYIITKIGLFSKIHHISISFIVSDPYYPFLVTGP